MSNGSENIAYKLDQTNALLRAIHDDMVQLTNVLRMIARSLPS